MIAARRQVLALGLSASTLVALGAPAAAQPSTVPPSAMPPPPGAPVAGTEPVRRVHRGIYLHADLGLALPTFTSTDTFDGSEIVVRGGGVGFGLAVGHTLRDNFVIHGALFVHSVSNPTVTINGANETLTDTSLDLIAIGIGATYYFMPTNLSISATLVGARLSARQERDGIVNEPWTTDSGGGLSLAVGKEWYVGKKVGLGVAAQLFVGSLTDTGEDPTAVDDMVWSTASFGLLFSATYN